MTRPAKPAAIAAALLAVALSAGCGSSGGGAAGGFPTSTPAAITSSAPAAPPTAMPTTALPTTDDLRSFHNAASGISLTVPQGYVVATTPTEAASRFPAVLGSDPGTKITGAQTRLRANTIMVAYHGSIGGLFDNVGLLKVVNAAILDPAEIQSPARQTQIRTELTTAGAKNVVFSDTKLDGQLAEQAVYAIVTTNGSTVYGQQYYLPRKADLYILTVTGGTARRAADAADEIAASWTFS